MLNGLGVRKLASMWKGLPAGLALVMTGAVPAEVVTVPGDDFIVEVWDMEDGLPHSSVSSIAQTPDGYLWIGMFYGGLARFDGVRFTALHPGNTPEMPSMEVFRLDVDAEGTLWVGMVEGAVLSRQHGAIRFEFASALRTESWFGGVLGVDAKEVRLASLGGRVFRGSTDPVTGKRRWEAVDLPEAFLLTTVCEDAEGTVWYLRQDDKLGRFQAGEFVLREEWPGLESAQIRALGRDGHGRIWVGTAKELAMWSGDRFRNMTPTNDPAPVGFRQMAFGPAGEIWLRTDRGFRKWVNGQWRVIAEPLRLGQRTDLQPMSLHPDAQGGVWLVRYVEGLWYLDAEGRLARIGREQGLPSDLIEAFFLDREGNVWVGPTGGGLISVRRRTVHPLLPGKAGEATAVCSVCEDTQGDLWLGIAGNRVLRVHDQVVTPLELPIERTAANFTIAYPDRNGRMWIGSVQNGVWLWQSNTLRRPFPLDEVGTVARAFLQDRSGRMWIGNEFGLYLWQDELLKKFGEADGFTPAFVFSFAEDQTGNLWIGTAGGELRQFKDGQFETFRPADRRESPTALLGAASDLGPLKGVEQYWVLYCDAEGVLWIGTLGGGLLRFEDGRFTRFSTAEGLPNDHVCQVLEDELGYLWLGTRGGIVRVPKRDLTAFARGQTEGISWSSYGRFDGMPTIECSGGLQPACWRSRDGRLWFSTVKGAVWVDPNRVPFNPLPPPVIVEGLRVDNHWVYTSEQHPAVTAPTPHPIRTELPVRIPAGQHYFEFKFTAPSFTSPDKVRFRWRLTGGDKPLTGGGAERGVSFNHLPPGRYEFHVTACNNDGVWNPTGASLGFTVLPYFWQTWWFKFLVLAAVVALVGGLYSVRIARLRALERLRLRIARDLHDEVGANLGSISLLAQVMEKHPSAEDAREVRSIAAQTVDTLRDIVWFIDPAHERLSDLVARMAETAKTMLHGVPYDFEQSGDFGARGLPLDFRRNVLPIFKEALHNAIKHAGATHLRIVVRREGDTFRFTVQDNGRGFAPATSAAGNGLKNMRRRASEMRAELQIHSEPGQGTTVALRARIR